MDEDDPRETMTFDRVKWLEDTLAEAETEWGPGLDQRKANLTVLSLLADENGVIQVTAIEQALGLSPGDLQDRWGESLALKMPG